MGSTGGEPTRQPRGHRDLLIDPPPEILDNILGRIPACDAVRTSILSRAWRRRWESFPNLDIDIWDVEDGSVATFLEHCAAPFGSLTIRSGNHLSCSSCRVDEWVRLVAGKRPRSLSLLLPSTCPYTSLPSLFACDPASLIELQLFNCVLPLPPAGFTGFRSLTEVELVEVIFTGEQAEPQLEAMIVAAPALERLCLVGIAFLIPEEGSHGRWFIQSQNLRRLVLCLWAVDVGLWDLGALPKLEYINVSFNDLPGYRDYVKLLTPVSHVTELHIGNFDNATYQDAQVNVLQGLSWVFKNLRILKLETHFHEAPTTFSTFHLLHCAPGLHSLEITDLYRARGTNELAEYMAGTLLNFGSVSNLQYLYMNSVSCSPNDMHFIKHVLRYSKNLCLLSVDLFWRSRKSVSEVSIELKECEILSPMARVCLKKGDDNVAWRNLAVFCE